MKILQFAFDSQRTRSCLTTFHSIAWPTPVPRQRHNPRLVRDRPEVERDYYRRYTSRDGSDVSWDLIRLAWASPPTWPLHLCKTSWTSGRTHESAGCGRRLVALADAARRPGDWAMSRLIEMTEVYGRAAEPKKDSA